MTNAIQLLATLKAFEEQDKSCHILIMGIQLRRNTFPFWIAQDSNNMLTNHLLTLTATVMSPQPVKQTKDNLRAIYHFKCGGKKCSGVLKFINLGIFDNEQRTNWKEKLSSDIKGKRMEMYSIT